MKIGNTSKNLEFGESVNFSDRKVQNLKINSTRKDPINHINGNFQSFTPKPFGKTITQQQTPNFFNQSFIHSLSNFILLRSVCCCSMP